jgi:hypothetical protein
MGLPISGAFARSTQLQAPYAGAGKWGTGIDPIHSRYTGPPRPGGIGVPNDLDQRTPPTTAADDVEYGPPWGAPDDPSYLDSVASEYAATVGDQTEDDNWPNWGDGITETGRDVPPGYPGWNESGVGIRSKWNPQNGPRQTTMSEQTPDETVSEGWINKGVTGHLIAETENDAEPADNKQVFVQTSMVQRKYGMSQPRTLMRGGPDQDVPRSDIAPRTAGPKVKRYSGELRHYDMFPRQIDDIPRPFYYRTAGTGPNPYLYNNAVYPNTPMQRTPPPDPSQGLVDTELTNPDDSGSYGYTSEEWGY